MLRRVLIAGSAAYLLAVLAWFVVHRIWGDPVWIVFLLSSLAFYLFLPVVAVAVAGLFLRRYELWAGGLAIALLGAFVFAGYLLPRAEARPAEGPRLSVMTYNILGSRTDPAATVAAIRASGADIVALQELDAAAGEAFARDLAAEYPYQLLAPNESYYGMGIISRHPFDVAPADLGHHWIGDPQVVTVAVPRIGPVTVVNAHALHPVSWVDGSLDAGVRERERTARLLGALAAQTPHPVVVLTDFNAGELSGACQILRESFRDAWLQAGTGLGHTWGRRTMFGVTNPLWLTRIDYVLHTPNLQTLAVEAGPWDGASDHQPVRAILTPAAGAAPPPAGYRRS